MYIAQWIIIIMGCWYAFSFSGCSDRAEDHDDTDSETAPPIHSGTESVADSATDFDTVSAVGPEIDTSDGFGGADEECYVYDAGDTSLMWCDTPDLVMQQCPNYASGCCCRTPCSPAMCDGQDETLPCTVYDSQHLLGYCDYTIDNVPVDYECENACTPRSACNNGDTGGDCMDSDANLTGVCLEDGSQQYCQPSCSVSLCDDTHFCSPLFENDIYDGTGACLLR